MLRRVRAARRRCVPQMPGRLRRSSHRRGRQRLRPTAPCRVPCRRSRRSSGKFPRGPCWCSRVFCRSAGLRLRRCPLSRRLSTPQPRRTVRRHRLLQRRRNSGSRPQGLRRWYRHRQASLSRRGRRIPTSRICRRPSPRASRGWPACRASELIAQAIAQTNRRAPAERSAREFLCEGIRQA